MQGLGFHPIMHANPPTANSDFARYFITKILIHILRYGLKEGKNRGLR